MRERIYCTGCGREIRDGLLYCDRCGRSVKKSIQQQKPLKYRQIEEIHKERRERKQRQQEMAAKRKQQKQKALKRTRVLVLVLALLIIALVSSIVAFVKMSGDKSMKDMDDVIRENVEATTEPSEEPENVVTVTTMPDTSGYAEVAVSGQKISYPSTFTSAAAEGDETARFKDPSGDAEISVGRESVSGSAIDMMSEYFSKTGVEGEPDVNSANKTRYLITYTKDGEVIHRKLVIKDGAAVYYDFTYSESSSKKSEYEKYISEMDTLFTE